MVSGLAVARWDLGGAVVRMHGYLMIIDYSFVRRSRARWSGTKLVKSWWHNTAGSKEDKLAVLEKS